MTDDDIKYMEGIFAEGHSFSKYIRNHANKMGITNEELVISISLILHEIAKSDTGGFLSVYGLYMDLNNLMTTLIDKKENKKVLAEQLDFYKTLSAEDKEKLKVIFGSVEKITQDKGD